MNLLIPFSKKQKDIGLKSIFFNKSQIIELKYIWTAENTDILISDVEREAPGPRKNELWKKTCFECFIKDRNSSRYWEVNLGSEGEWNVYQFNDYRKPHPPEEFREAQLLSFKYEPGLLETQILFPAPYLKEIKIGLTAVIEHLHGEKNYYSLAHLKEQPDFHDESSYLLERIFE